MNSDKKYNYLIIGAGIVGLATALSLLDKNPNSKIVLLEKESEIGKHQTGNNSGVIHSGIYYKPGSLKAENCKKGNRLLLDFCDKNDIEYNICGKIIIATNLQEETELVKIFERGKQNKIEVLKVLNKEEIKNYEPNATGSKAIFVPSTGIIDFKKVLQKYKELIEQKDGTIVFNSSPKKIIEKSDSIEVITNNKTFITEKLISCAGLQSDRVARLTENNLPLRIIPFRGEYYKLKSDKTNLVKGLIYPVPDPAFPFLGVHFTKKIDGNVEAGPNAVLAFKREGYSKTSFNLYDTWETLTWKGFRKVAAKYWQTGLGEFYRSFSKKSFVKALQKLIPDITEEDLIPGGAGIRAQACSSDGELIDDFSLIKSKRILHVCNAPSPAATASLAIGEQIANEIVN
jgi:L-2-hydroxyglutarate oxidase